MDQLITITSTTKVIIKPSKSSRTTFVIEVDDFGFTVTVEDGSDAAQIGTSATDSKASIHIDAL